jgi:PTH1 family peptidyl-tRNA hydrolase
VQENKPILIVGLGNPGAGYSGTRHNAGFMAADALAGRDAVWKPAHKALVFSKAAGRGAMKIIFAKPQTFMNLSGLSVQAAMSFYKIPSENLIVIHDDIDLKTGDVRVKLGGGSAGHNGIKSIDSAIGRDYHRIRVGVGRPPENIDPSDWVLGKISDEEQAKIDGAILKIIDMFHF